MNDAAGPPAGLMVLRLWTEPGDRMRVRVTQTSDLASGVTSTSYASTREDVLALVDRWLDLLVTHR